MIIPVIPLKNIVIIPDVSSSLEIKNDLAKNAVKAAMENDQTAVAAAEITDDEKHPNDTLCQIGTLVKIEQVLRMPSGALKVIVKGQEIVRIEEFTQKSSYLEARVTKLDDADENENATGFERAKIQYGETAYETNPEDAVYGNRGTISSFEELSAKKSALIDKLKELEAINKKIPPELCKLYNDDVSLLHMLNVIAAYSHLTAVGKQGYIEKTELSDKYDYILMVLSEEIEISKIKLDINEKVHERLNKNQREYVLREQMKVIREELGEESVQTDADEFAEKTKELEAPHEVKEKLTKEIRRMRALPSQSPESGILKTYIETVLEIPWEKRSNENKDYEKAKKILEEDHYGLTDVKERILEFIAVKNLSGMTSSPILCLIGPPGTGKTSIAKSIARALDRKFVRVSLGGVHDEAEIRGHRKTYVGAMPGRIATAMKQVAVKNPVILLDEIDKVSNDSFKGDTASALLEVLDSEQNVSFRDHYLELPLDLSEVFFITTANDVSGISKPLYDRMEVINVSSYTENEKFHIAKGFLIPKQFEKNGLTKEHLIIEDDAIKKLIRNYTREAGVRELERKIGSLCRKVAKRLLEDDVYSVTITKDDLEKYMGKIRYRFDNADKNDEVGIARGLAWTAVGGDTLTIEANVIPGKGEVSLTGQLGDVMKESAKTGLTYIKSISSSHGIEQDFFEKHDLHVHVPSGAVPKDGPSAGITMACAMFSAASHMKIKSDVAMTGEITLTGRVLPIGGLKEKLLAAKTAGVKKVLVPKENIPDVSEISGEITGGLDIVYVSHMDEVLRETLW